MYVEEEGSGLEESEGEELTLLEEWMMIDGKVLAEVWWQAGRSWRKDGTKIYNKAHFVCFRFSRCALSCVLAFALSLLCVVLRL